MYELPSQLKDVTPRAAPGAVPRRCTRCAPWARGCRRRLVTIGPVQTHPETGTEAVWFHKGKTETVTGMSPEETEDLTGEVAQPQFCYAHEYKKHDLLIIDDRASLHKAGFDYNHSQHLRLYRVLVRDDRPC